MLVHEYIYRCMCWIQMFFFGIFSSSLTFVFRLIIPIRFDGFKINQKIKAWIILFCCCFVRSFVHAFYLLCNTSIYSLCCCYDFFLLRHYLQFFRFLICKYVSQRVRCITIPTTTTTWTAIATTKKSIQNICIKHVYIYRGLKRKKRGQTLQPKHQSHVNKQPHPK